MEIVLAVCDEGPWPMGTDVHLEGIVTAIGVVGMGEKAPASFVAAG